MECLCGQRNFHMILPLYCINPDIVHTNEFGSTIFTTELKYEQMTVGPPAKIQASWNFNTYTIPICK